MVGYEAISKPGKLAWYGQKGEPGSTEWAEHLIGVIIGPMSHDLGDVDQDGDPYVVAGEHYVKEPSGSRLYFFENEDGRSIKWRSHIIHIGDEHHDGGKLIDIDGNGDLDVISIGWTHPKVIIYENNSYDYFASDSTNNLRFVQSINVCIYSKQVLYSTEW